MHHYKLLTNHGNIGLRHAQNNFSFLIVLARHSRWWGGVNLCFCTVWNTLVSSIFFNISTICRAAGNYLHLHVDLIFSNKMKSRFKFILKLETESVKYTWEWDSVLKKCFEGRLQWEYPFLSANAIAKGSFTRGINVNDIEHSVSESFMF